MGKFCRLIMVLLIFVVGSAYALLSPSRELKPVKFSSQNLEINHRGSELSTEGSRIRVSSPAIDNKKLDINSKNIVVNNYSNIDNANVKLYNSSNFHNVDAKFSNQPYKRNELPINVSKEKYSYAPEAPRYKTAAYEDINWNTWHSRFVNQILDDSLKISALDSYPPGTKLTYKFTVHNNGVISDISVRSSNLSLADRTQLAEFIKSYQYKSITIFPKNSKRKTAVVEAAIELVESDMEYASPNDFNDKERVKINY